MIRTLALLAVWPLLLVSCRSPEPATPASRLEAMFHPPVQPGAYYKMKRLTTVYQRPPDGLIAETPSEFHLGYEVVQLLEANAGSGWVRIRTPTKGIGYTQLTNLIAQSESYSP